MSQYAIHIIYQELHHQFSVGAGFFLFVALTEQTVLEDNREPV